MDCPNCEKDRDRLGQHWAMSCEYPNIPDYMKSLFVGLLMGDGHVPNVSYGNPQMRIRMVNKPFLNWLDCKLEYMSNGVRFIQSAEDSAEYMKDRGFRPNADSENYSDVWELNTRTHPYFNEMRDTWYNPSKVFPLDDITLNSTVVKMWYVTDGYICDRSNHNKYSAFRLDSQSEIAIEISEKLSNKGFKCTVRDSGNVIAVSPDSTDQFLNWLGEAPDGFEYKWGN